MDNGKLRIYYEEPYAVVPEGSFYHERGFVTFLDAYNALFSLSEMTYLEPTLLVSGEEARPDMPRSLLARLTKWLRYSFAPHSS